MSANLADLNINLALIPGAFNQANQIQQFLSLFAQFVR